MNSAYDCIRNMHLFADAVTYTVASIETSREFLLNTDVSNILFYSVDITYKATGIGLHYIEFYVK